MISSRKHLQIALTAFFSMSAYLMEGQVNLEFLYDYSFGHHKAIHFMSDNVGVIAEDDNIKLTADGGISWLNRFEPGLRPTHIRMSIIGNDTLFVVSEIRIPEGPVRNRVRYFHGFQGPSTIIHKSTLYFQQTQGSLFISDSSIYVAGALIDTTDIHPVTNQYESIVITSHDHGHTWNIEKIPVKPIGFHYIESVHLRNSDTLVVSWQNNKDYTTALYYNGLQAAVIPYNGLQGRVMDCNNEDCLIVDRYNVVRMQHGADPLDFKIILPEWCFMSFEYPAKLFSENEFLIVNSALSCRADTSGLMVFEYDYSKVSDSLISDTNVYDYWNKLPGPQLGYFSIHQVSVTENYVYLIESPYIVKINRHQLDVRHFIGYSPDIDIAYSDDRSELILFGINPTSEYHYEFYSVSGKKVSRTTEIIDARNNRIKLNEYQTGAYLIVLQELHSGLSLVKKVIIN